MKLDVNLFEDMSSFYMETYGFPPLTANIFTLLLFDFSHEGITFDEILEATHASKSSVSNALNRMLQSNHIEFFTKLEERKRFYRINKSIFKVQFLNKVHKAKEEHKILRQFADKRAKALGETDKESQKLKLHMALQENIIHLYEQTLNALNDIH